MGLLSRRPKRATHTVEIHFAQPMSPSLRHQHEDGIVGQLLPQLGASAEVVGGGTALSADGEPESADLVRAVTTADMGSVFGRLAVALEDNGMARGSWIRVDGGTQHAVGKDEYVLLRTGTGQAPLQDPEQLTAALQGALGDGRLGWHDETYAGSDGPVYVFGGPSAPEIVVALRAEIPRHPQLAAAECVTVAPGPAPA